MLNFDSVNLLSVFAIMLGPFVEWENQFEQFIENGFRAFHIMPIQKLGKTKSSHSIFDHLLLNEEIFGENFHIEKLSQFFSKLRMKHQVFFVTEIIWNHCSVESEWIYDEPDCLYIVKNCPSLNIAFILNQCLLDTSIYLQNIGKKIETHEDVDHVIELIQRDIFDRQDFHEYFQIDVESELENYLEYLILLVRLELA